MKVVKKKTDNGHVLLDVTASTAEVSQALNQASEQFCVQMNIQPVRGKTPAEIVSERLGIKDLDSVVSEQAAQMLVPPALNKHNLIPAFQPQPKAVMPLKRGRVFQYSMDVLPKPSFELDDYSPVKFTAQPFTSDEEEVDRQISQLAQQYITFAATEPHPVQKGDSILISMRTTKDGVEIPGLTTNSRSYTTGLDLMPVGFDDNLFGMEVGETRTFTFEGPGLDENMNEIMEEYETTITLLEVQKEVVPVVDDAWVQKNLPMYADLADMRKKIGEDLDKDRRKYYEDYKRNVAATELAKRFKGTIPDVIYENSMHETRENMRQQVSRSGMKWEEFLEKNGGEQQVNMMLMVEMRQNLVMGFALDAYYRHEGLMYNEDDLNEVCFQMNPKNPAIARQSMERNGYGYALRESAERLRACKRLVETAEIKESDQVGSGSANGPIFVNG